MRRFFRAPQEGKQMQSICEKNPKVVGDASLFRRYAPYKSRLRNQQCEPKKISVRKTPKPQRFRGFVMPFFKVKFKRYHIPKTTFGEDLN